MTKPLSQIGWQELATQIKAWREKPGLSRRTVANAVGTTERTLARWEDEGVVPPTDKFLRLVAYYRKVNELTGLLRRFDPVSRADGDDHDRVAGAER